MIFCKRAAANGAIARQRLTSAQTHASANTKPSASTNKEANTNTTTNTTHTHTTHERAQATSDKHTVAGVRASTHYNKVPSSYLGEARYAKCTTHLYRRSWLKRMAHVVCFLCQFGIIAGSVAW